MFVSIKVTDVNNALFFVDMKQIWAACNLAALLAAIVCFNIYSISLFLCEHSSEFTTVSSIFEMTSKIREINCSCDFLIICIWIKKSKCNKYTSPSICTRQYHRRILSNFLFKPMLFFKFNFTYDTNLASFNSESVKLNIQFNTYIIFNTYMYVFGIEKMLKYL